MTPSLPSWVQKRDGRREPFDAGKISQGLYAATEAIGAPSAFLARELTDGVLHFLEQENLDDAPTTGQIAELVEKIVRELGHPNLAHAFAQRPARDAVQPASAKAARDQATFTFSSADDPETVVAQSLSTYSRHAIFARDIAAASAAELLVLAGLEEPRQLEALALDPPARDAPGAAWLRAWSQVGEARRLAGKWLVVDSPERFLPAHGPEWLEAFAAGLQAHQCRAILNLRVATPPAWANVLVAGPLFGKPPPPQRASNTSIAAILEAVRHDRTGRLYVYWHIQAADYDDPVGYHEMQTLLLGSDLLPRITFVFDRPRQSLVLGRGTDRTHPATLMRVVLGLRRFIELPEVAADPEKMLAKLPSLMRMAVSAAVQKRNYLRRHNPELTRGFLLDRSRLVTVPGDLDATVAALVGAAPLESKLALDTAQQLLATLSEAAKRESRASNLDIAVVHEQTIDAETFETDGAAELRRIGALLTNGSDGLVRLLTGPLKGTHWWQYMSAAWRAPGIARMRFVLEG